MNNLEEVAPRSQYWSIYTSKRTKKPVWSMKRLMNNLEVLKKAKEASVEHEATNE
jgi:hypothetical protein